MDEVFDILKQLVRRDYPELNETEVALKCARWVLLPNLNFGGYTPEGVVNSGKAKKVILYIQRQIEGNQP